MRTLLLVVLLLQIAWARGPEAPLQVPEQYTQDANRLADYLTGSANTPRLKAERIYNWIAANINYDIYMYKAKGAVRDCSPPTVLKRRQSVCAGYATLFETMARRAGLEVQVIPGIGRSQFGGSAESHAWNVVKLDGQWQLVDCTWGAGYVNNEEFHRSFTDFYFCADPKEFLTSHFPDDSKWQLVESPVSRAEFDGLTPMQAHRAGTGTIIPIQDYSGQAAPPPPGATSAAAPPLVSPRQLSSFLYRGTRLLKPTQGTLRGGSLEFHLEVPLADRVLVTTGGTSYALVAVPGKLGQFRAMVPISSGQVKVLAEFGGSGRLEPLLEYEAR
ncbi:MAG: transglutaminase domain-containing protein [Vulcanimicrobiota bacterium]